MVIVSTELESASWDVAKGYRQHSEMALLQYTDQLIYLRMLFILIYAAHLMPFSPICLLALLLLHTDSQE